MNFTKLNSSNLAGAYHDGTDLYLEFNKGPVYKYLEVSHLVYDALLESESAGKFFHLNIRDHFAFELVKETAIN